MNIIDLATKAMQTTINTAVSGVRTVVDSISNAVAGVRTVVDNIKSTTDTTKTTVDAIDSRTNITNFSVDAIKSVVDGTKTKVDTLDTRTNTMNGNVNTINTNVGSPTSAASSSTSSNAHAKLNYLLANRSVIKRIQSGRITSTTDALNINISTVNLAKSILICDANNTGGVMVFETSSVLRYYGSTAEVFWQVIEFN